jgi:hypothetical protein
MFGTRAGRAIFGSIKEIASRPQTNDTEPSSRAGTTRLYIQRRPVLKNGTACVVILLSGIEKICRPNL